MNYVFIVIIKEGVEVKKIRVFVLRNCPYCKAAVNYISELKQDPKYSVLELEFIDENEQVELANSFDYYYVPCFYYGDEKLSEGAISLQKTKEVFEDVLSR